MPPITRAHRTSWAVTAILALTASCLGLWSPGMYAGVVADNLIPGAYSQDLISAAAAIVLLLMAATARTGRPKAQLTALGLLGYLFYAYGIYVIERTYNSLYLGYMAIFTLAFWSLVWTTACRGSSQSTPSLPRTVRVVSASGALLQPLIFYPLWIGMLLPLMSSGEQIDSLYSIFILDLCFIMPAFLILSLLTFRSAPAGLVLLPALYFLGFTLIFSLVLGELVKPFFGSSPAGGPLVASAVLSSLFLVLGLLHLYRLRFVPNQAGGPSHGLQQDLPDK